MIANIRIQLATVLSSVATVGYPPASIATPALPMAVLLLDGLTAELRGVGGMAKYTLTFRVELVVSPVAQSKGESVIQVAEGKLEDAVSALLANPTLNGSVDHLERIDSEGVHVLGIAGTDYYAAVFRVTYVIK